MRKLVLWISSAMILALFLFGFAGCGNADTFTGQLSGTTYATAEAAAQGYLENEINGETMETKFVSYTKDGDLSRGEIENLTLGEQNAADITAAESGKILYIEANTSVTADAIAGKTRKVTLVQIGGEYRYYVEPSAVGEIISRTYYESVMDYRNYLNCTIKLKSDILVSDQSSAVSMYALSQDFTIKITETAIEFNCAIESDGEEQSVDLYYVFDEDGMAYGYLKQDEKWRNIPGSFSAQEILQSGMEPLGDHTFFVKTGDGFAIAEDKLNYFIEAYLSDCLDSLGLNVNGVSFSFQKVVGSYFVKDGKLSKETSALEGKITAFGKSLAVVASSEVTYSEFDTTNADMPEDLKEYLKTI